MMIAGNLLAIGRDGEVRRFSYRCYVGPKLYDNLDRNSERLHWELSVWHLDEDPDSVDAGYRATAVEVDSEQAISIEMFSDRPGFSEVGLPEATLGELAKLCGRSLWSSTRLSKAVLLKSENRTPAADKVWRRLSHAGRVIYEARTDRFRYLEDSPSPGLPADACRPR